MKNVKQSLRMLFLFLILSVGISSCLRNSDANPDDTRPNTPSISDPAIFEDIQSH
jgi:hypothetical protein